MANDGCPDTSRTVVQTYVPAYQRDAWDEHADQLNMSRSEFVKAMVQAGRKQFGAEPATGIDLESEADSDSQDLERDIIETLRESGACSWEELLAGVTGDIETRLEDSLQELQESDRIRYSGRDGGYILKDNE